MKRTNVVVDEKKVIEARRLTGLRTLRDLVDAGLEQLINRAKRLRLLELKGTIDWQGDLAAWRADRG